MDSFTRLNVGSRTFSLAAIFGLALALDGELVLRVAVALTVLAVLGTYLSTKSAMPVAWAVSAEALMASLVVATTLPDSLLVLPYLVILALLGGLTAGVTGAAMVVVVQLTALLLTTATSTTPGTTAEVRALAPWALTIVSAGLLGAWTRKVRKTSAPRGDENYASARRLLVQLRTVSRRLSSGLDPVTIAHDILKLLHESVEEATASAVVVRSDSRSLVPLAYVGPGAAELSAQDEALIEQAWRTGVVATQADPDGPAPDARATYVVPLRVGSECSAVLVSRVAGHLALPPRTQDLLEDLALRLETALTFESIRSAVMEDERHRVAREIHDGVAQDVASLGYVVDEIASMTSDEKVSDALGRLRSEVTRVVNELRLSIFDLRSDVRDAPGLGAALSDYLRVVGLQSSLSIHTSIDESPTRLSPQTETELLRIAQEAITNARRHSGAENLWVELTVRAPRASLVVRDDGKGLGPRRHDSYGLHGMRERADRINATLTVQDLGHETDQRGTCVTVHCAGEERHGPTRAAAPVRADQQESVG